jgi:hypothetical protein
MSERTYNLEEIHHVFTDTAGVEHVFFDEDVALAYLLLDGVVFCNQRKYLNIDGTTAGYVTVIFMNCNDVFIWACADGEALINDDIKPLFLAWHTDKHYGPLRWVCIKRQEKPQSPLVRDMKAAGFWDDVMEALPENTFDSYNKNKDAP